jgi:hypothetical protein
LLYDAGKHLPKLIGSQMRNGSMHVNSPSMACGTLQPALLI